MTKPEAPVPESAAPLPSNAQIGGKGSSEKPCAPGAIDQRDGFGMSAAPVEKVRQEPVAWLKEWGLNFDSRRVDLKMDCEPWLRALNPRITPLYASPVSATPAIDMAQMVDRFLAWRLPNDFSPDCGIAFKPINHPDALTRMWPIGTNLFTADQAKAMLEHVTAPLQEMVADALRYRWLQSRGCGNAYGKVGTDEDCYLQLNPRDMDAAIDAALSSTNNSKEK